MKTKLTQHHVEAAVKGGSVYAAGGGGWVEHGLQMGGAAVAIGQPELVTVDEVPDDAIIITSAAIGAPAGTTDWQMLGVDYIRAVELLQEAIDAPIYGTMASQNGMMSSTNGWLPASVLGLKVLDAAGDIRAHPTGNMGCIGLNARKDWQTVQTLVGGKKETGSYLELVVKGTLAKTSTILRTASDMSGGFAASARNPIDAAYVKKNAAIGAIGMAISLGEAILEAEKQGADVVQAICKHTHGEIVGKGKVLSKKVQYTQQAFDIGTIVVGEGAHALTLHVMNEYMAIDDAQGKRISTFPDVITTLDTQGKPLSVGQVREGQEILVFRIDKKHTPLSAGVKDPSVYPDVEKAMGIDLASYALA